MAVIETVEHLTRSIIRTAFRVTISAVRSSPGWNCSSSQAQILTCSAVCAMNIADLLSSDFPCSLPRPVVKCGWQKGDEIIG